MQKICRKLDYRLMEKLKIKESIDWADSNGIHKITLHVLEENDKAINLYKKFGFKTEGILENDKILSDGQYYNTVVMGRFNR